jgi:sigma-B regulation protein RsbU (phosphoserine phosphatase)
MFITLFLGVLHVPDGRLEFVNAGHVKPFWLTAGGAVQEIACPVGLPLGIMENAVQPTTTVTLQPNDGLVVITDGLPDMTDADDAFYSMERVTNDLRELCALPPEPLINGLCERVLRFAGSAEQADDVTALALRLTG